MKQKRGYKYRKKLTKAQGSYDETFKNYEGENGRLGDSET
jgi:hypothetical protein